MPQIQTGEAVLDYGIYPRAGVNNVHVGHLVDALRTGAALPPVIIDRTSRRVVDGFHRTTAKLRFAGPDAPMEVEERDYADEASLFLDCVRLNAAHGMPLTPYDRAKVATMADKLQIAEALVAESLHIPADRLAALVARKTAIGTDGAPLPIKGTGAHLSGMHLSERQETAMRKAAGMKTAFYANQILIAVRGDLIDLEHRPTMERLQELYDLLRGVLHGEQVELA